MLSTIINTMGPGPIIERIALTYADFSKAATTSTIEIKTLLKGAFLIDVRLIVKEDFAGGSVSAATIAIGSKVASDVDHYVEESDVFTGVAADTSYAYLNVQAGYAAETLTATLVTTTANADALTAGKVYVDVVYIQPEDLTGTGPTGNALATGGQL